MRYASQLLALFVSSSAAAQLPPVGPDRPTVDHIAADGRSGFGYLERPVTACLTPRQRAGIHATIAANRQVLLGRGLLGGSAQADVRFRWPLRAVGSAADDFGVHGISNFVDLDPTGPGNLLDYNCGTRTYDRPNG